MGKVEWLLMRVKEVEAERDALRTQLAEVEAQAAQMREALGLFTQQYEHPKLAEREGKFYALVRLTDDQWAAVQAALSSAGRETAERLRLLEELAEAATAFTEWCTIVECFWDKGEPICYADTCLRGRLVALVHALQGGDIDAGTQA